MRLCKHIDGSKTVHVTTGLCATSNIRTEVYVIPAELCAGITTLLGQLSNVPPYAFKVGTVLDGIELIRDAWNEAVKMNEGMNK